jgi:fumarate hydratase class II
MVCAKVIGNDVSISVGGMQGHYELNVFKPLIGSTIIESANLLGESCVSFSKNCFDGIKANKKRINELLNNSLMLVTALAPHIGYDNAAKIAKTALKNNTSLKHEALKTKLIDEKDYNEIVDPKKMIYPE